MSAVLEVGRFVGGVLFFFYDYVMYEPYRESLRATLTRTGSIALILGAVLAWRFGGLASWPANTLLALWPSLGGHFVELVFLNVIRQRIPDVRVVQVAARVGVWFLGGIVLTMGMRWTAMLVGVQFPPRLTWWLGGLAFIVIEIGAHVVLSVFSAFSARRAIG